MDKETRNRIERATQSVRGLLEQDFADQLEGMFDIRLDGTLVTEPGSHLDAAQRVLQRKLVAAVEHNQASGQMASEAVTAYLREAAFTTLNRFVALKMLEARDLVQECISRGDQSAGFREFCGLAPGLVQLPDHGYRHEMRGTKTVLVEGASGARDQSARQAGLDRLLRRARPGAAEPGRSARRYHLVHRVLPRQLPCLVRGDRLKRGQAYGLRRSGPWRHGCGHGRGGGILSDEDTC